MEVRTMAEKKPARSRKTAAKASETFSAEERAAMRETIRERKAGSKNGEADVLAKIAEMPKPDREKATRIHAIVKDVAPELAPRTWYGMPAYTKDDKVLVFFRSAHKFKSRYATLGFSDRANLDDGAMWPTDFALKDLTAAEEKKIRALVKKAVTD
jgi:uncharacterized protein YdhG (YjbR/CyaY superfamily)